VRRLHFLLTNNGLHEMDMIKFTSAMLDAIEHCAREAKIDVEWRSVCVADMRDAYDLLTRKLARDGTDPSAQANGVLIAMALDGNISELQQLLADHAPESQIAEKPETL
jgi:hypothetical protein